MNNDNVLFNFDIPLKLLPLFRDNDYSIEGLVGGRGGAKSETIAVRFIMLAFYEADPYVKIGCAREILNSIKDSSKSLITRKIKQSTIKINDKIISLERFFEIKERSIICKHNEVEIIFFGLQDHTLDSVKSKDKLKYVWVEEAQSVTVKSIEILEPTVFRNENSKIYYTWNSQDEDTPINVHLITNAPPNTRITRINYNNNPFVSKQLLYIIKNLKKTNLKAYNHTYLDHFREQNNDAIWTKELIDKNRISILPELVRAVIGIDPPGKSEKENNAKRPSDNSEWGIVALGLTIEYKTVILGDASGTFTPKVAKGKALALANQWQVDLIIAENNFGGQMVEDVFTSDDDIEAPRVELVRAITSKRFRALPFLNEYENGNVSHYGYFPELEYQMTNWDESQKYSPDRMDAAVHGGRHLITGVINTNIEVV